MPRCPKVSVHSAGRTPFLQNRNFFRSLSWTDAAISVDVSDEEKLTLANWQIYSKRSFPPCMAALVDQLFVKRPLRFSLPIRFASLQIEISDLLI